MYSFEDPSNTKGCLQLKDGVLVLPLIHIQAQTFFLTRRDAVFGAHHQQAHAGDISSPKESEWYAVLRPIFLSAFRRSLFTLAFGLLPPSLFFLSVLFLGTEKYPHEGAFEKFLTQHGGSSNAVSRYPKRSATDAFVKVAWWALPFSSDACLLRLYYF